MAPKIKEKMRRVVLHATDRPRPPAREKPVPVIVEVAADGWIQVYGADNVRVHVFNRLRIDNAAMADDVDEFHLLDMPRPYRQLYFPRHVRATGLVEKRTVEAEYLRREKLKTLREFQRMADDAKKGRKRQ